MKQSPFLNSWKRERRREKYLFFPTLQEEERGKFFEVSWFLYFEMDGESSLMINRSWLRLMLLRMLWFTVFSWGFLNVKAYVWKRGENWRLCLRMFHSSNLCFYFNFMMFICLIERPISPQASMGLKIWKIEAIVGRLCQNFYKIMCRKLQQLKHA